MPKQRKQRHPSPDRMANDLEEVHMLLEGFEQELRKLDEALEALSAYLLRLQCQRIARRVVH